MLGLGRGAKGSEKKRGEKGEWRGGRGGEGDISKRIEYIYTSV